MAVATYKGIEQQQSAAADLQLWIDSQASTWLSIEGYSPNDVRRIRGGLLSAAASGRQVDYGTAEQGLLGIVTLTTYLGEGASLDLPINQLFDALGNDEQFSPRHYAAVAKRVMGEF
jgi:hypothetical protein